MLNIIHRDKIRRRELKRDRKILSDHRQDGNVAVGGIVGNLAIWGPSTVRYRTNKKHNMWVRRKPG